MKLLRSAVALAVATLACSAEPGALLTPMPGAVDAAPDDAPTSWELLDDSIDLGVLDIGAWAQWSLRARAGSKAIDLNQATIAFEDVDDWQVEGDFVSQRVQGGRVFEVRGRASATNALPLRAMMRFDAPGLMPLSIPIRGEARPDPRVLLDPEDIGFGPVELGRVASLRVVFHGEARVVDAGPSFTTSIQRGGGVTIIAISFAPTETGLSSAAVEVDGRSVPIGGRGVGTAVRVSPRFLDLDDSATGSCVEATVGFGNAGLGEAEYLVPTLETMGFVTASWKRLPMPQVLDPLEERQGELEICTTQSGPYEVYVVFESGRVATISGRARAAEIHVPEVDPPSIYVGLAQTFDVPVRNIGLLPLRVNRIERTGSTEVEVVTPTPIEIAPGRTENVHVRISAASSGSRTATLRIHNNDADRPTVDVDVSYDAHAFECDLLLRTPALDFGASAQPVGDASVAVLLENRGNTDCAIAIPTRLPDPLRWVAIPARAFFDDDFSTLTIAAGQRIALPVAMNRPNLGMTRRTFEILVAEGERPPSQLSIAVSAGVRDVGIRTAVARTPACVDDTTTAVSFTVRTVAVGPDPIRLGGIMATPHTIGLSQDHSQAQRMISPGTDSISVFTYTAPPAGTHSADLDIIYYLDNRLHVARRTIAVDVAPGEEQIDEFSRPGRIKSDLLFVIDASGSMDDISAIPRNINALARSIAASDADIHVAVTTADAWTGGDLSSRMGPSVIDTGALTGEALAHTILGRFAEAKNIGDSQLEAPLDAARLGLQNWRTSEMARPDAFPGVIIITDEDDASPGGVDAAEDHLRSLANWLSFIAIAGVPEDGCEEEAGTALPAPRIEAVARGFGGFTASACRATWNRLIQPPPAPGPFERYILTNQPNPESIRVAVDGAAFPRTNASGTERWRYDVSLNAIVLEPFHGLRPGAHLEVRYDAQCL